MNIQKDLLKSIYEYSSKLYDQKEKQVLSEIQQSSHVNNILYKLYKQGTRKDKIKSLIEFVKKEDFMLKFAFNELFKLIDNKFSKQKYYQLNAIKDLIISQCGLFLSRNKQNELLEIKSFQEFLNQHKQIKRQFQKKKKIDEETNQLLMKFFRMNFYKSRIEQFYDILKQLNAGNVNILQKETCSIIAELVKKTIPNVSNIFLPILINKIGDPSKQLFDLVSKTLNIMINNKTEQSLNIVKQIGEFLERQNQNLFAQQNSVIILSNINFSNLEDKNVAYYVMELFLNRIKAFIELYIKNPKSLKQILLREKFGKVKMNKKQGLKPLRILLKEKLEKSSKLLNNYVRGLNKILPNIKNFQFLEQFFDENLFFFFKFCRLTTGKTSIKILIFLFQIFKHDFQSKLSQRFLNLFYDLINNQSIFQSKSAEQIFDLLYNILKLDTSEERICSYIKRLFINVIQCDSKIILASLIFLSRIIQEKPFITKMISNHNTQTEKEQNQENGKDNKDNKDNKDGKDNKAIKNGKDVKDGNDDKDGKNGKNGKDDKDGKKQESGYLFLKRNPLYTNAINTQLWELIYLKNHFNPFIRKISHLLIEQKFSEIKYKGNPLQDYSNISILQWFTIQPKKQSKNVSSNKSQKSKRKQNLTYQNYKNLLKDDQKSISLYFDNKIKKLNTLKKIQSLKDNQQFIKNSGQQEINEFADELFEKEMKKLQNEDDFDFEDDQNLDNYEVDDIEESEISSLENLDDNLLKKRNKQPKPN